MDSTRLSIAFIDMFMPSTRAESIPSAWVNGFRVETSISAIPSSAVKTSATAVRFLLRAASKSFEVIASLPVLLVLIPIADSDSNVFPEREASAPAPFLLVFARHLALPFVLPFD